MSGAFLCVLCGDVDLAELPELYCELCKAPLIADARRESARKAKEKLAELAEQFEKIEKFVTGFPPTGTITWNGVDANGTIATTEWKLSLNSNTTTF